MRSLELPVQLSRSSIPRRNRSRKVSCGRSTDLAGRACSRTFPETVLPYYPYFSVHPASPPASTGVARLPCRYTMLEGRFHGKTR